MGCRFEFRTQKLPYERISGNFSDFINFGHHVHVCEKNHFSILAVFQNIWDLHKFGCRFEFTTQKLPHERISGNFSFFINFGHYAKKGHFSILAVFQNVWDLHKFRLQIWIQNTENYPMKEFRAIFTISSILVIRSGYAKKDFSY